jgi:glycerol-3-phosphate dehydrogenase
VRLSDFLLRRTLLGFQPDQGLAAVNQVAALMAREAGWTPTRMAAEIADFREWVAQSRAFRGEPVADTGAPAVL